VSRFDLVIFDNDGVLVDSEGHANQILSELLNETGVGLGMTREECMAEFMGRSMTTIRQLVEARLGRAWPGDLEDRYHARLFEVFATRLTAVPGVERALQRITIPTCVASSGTHERIRRALTATGLLPRFEGRIFSAQDVARGKPAPDLFLHAARSLGAAPTRCAVIEDSPLGVEAANAAGMVAFGFAHLTPPGLLANARGGTFSSMDDLPDLLSDRSV
jgi:HAD superfamily hydrolase (TIGR01509 family)